MITRLKIILALTSAILIGLISACSQEQETTAVETNVEGLVEANDTRPNIIYILADDMGNSDLSYMGSEIPTPNLDALARDGMILTNYYAGQACAATRAMFMSGTDNHVAGVGVQGPNNIRQRYQPGYEGRLNLNVASMAELLTDAGYNTYMTGKWHLGFEVDTSPAARGFKRSFISLDGAAHLGGLSWDGPGLAPYRDENELVTVPDDFYTTRFYTNRMIEYIEQDRDEGKPFFAWLAYTAPHWPLQAPEESIAKFKGVYDEGYEVIYQQRFERMAELGMLPEGAEPGDASIWQTPWASLSEEEQRMAAKRMEIYAAMVSDLDAYIGEIITYLKDTGQYENTMIVFSSDNGAESGRRDLNNSWVETCCDNSYENLGKAGSYVMYGREWASVSAVPFNRHKVTGYEGGMHVPAFVHFPGVVEPGTKGDGVVHIMDMLPTFLDVAGSSHPGNTYKGRNLKPITGVSQMAMFRGETESVRRPEDIVGFELLGYRSVRQGDWKINWDRAKGDDADWELYNLARDPSERVDLSVENPEKLAEMTELWDQYAQENGVIL